MSRAGADDPGGGRGEVRPDPAQYPDFAALRGDPSDNLPGIPGVGEKTAAKWIREFGSLDELVDRVDEVKGKAGDALREHLADVIRNRQLTELVRDVPLPSTPDDLARVRGTATRSHQVFDTLQFRVLRERLFASTLDEVEPRAPMPGFEVSVDAARARHASAAWLAEHAPGGTASGSP